MYDSYSFVLAITSCLFVNLAIPPAVHSTATQQPRERCVYNGLYHNLNQTQSHDIRCASRHLIGSTYYHKVHLNTDVSTMENQVDILYCEASSQTYQDLNLYEEAQRDGTKSLTSSGACLITKNSGVSCTRVVLYVNLTYYDQNNGSVIPVCAFNKSDENFNAECYCIHYLVLDTTTIITTTHMEPMTTTPDRGTITESEVTSSAVQPDLHSQPVISHSGEISAAAFTGTTSVLVIVIVILIVIVAALSLTLVVCYKKRKSPTHRPIDYDESPLHVSSRSMSLPDPSSVTKYMTKKCTGRSSDHIPLHHTGASADGHSDHDEEDDIFENHGLLQKSLSSPAGIYPT